MTNEEREELEREIDKQELMVIAARKTATAQAFIFLESEAEYQRQWRKAREMRGVLDAFRLEAIDAAMALGFNTDALALDNVEDVSATLAAAQENAATAATEKGA